MGGPPPPDARTGPFLAVEVEGTQSPPGVRAWPSIIGNHNRLIGQTISFLGRPVPGEFDTKMVFVFSNRCSRFPAHSQLRIHYNTAEPRSQF